MLKIEAKNSQNKADNLEHVKPEIWKEIDGYDGYYEVSNKGRVRSWKNNRWGRSKKPKILSQGTDNEWGYKFVILSKDNETSYYSVHRLVAIYFIDNPENKPEVNHIDGDKENNWDTNLEWNTHSENVKHDFKLGVRNMKGENHSQSKLTDYKVTMIRLKYATGLATKEELSNEFKISVSHVTNIISGKVWSHI